MAVRIGVVGAGSFAQCFIPLFQAHPLVEDVALCDLDRRKLNDVGDRFGIQRRFESLEDLMHSDVTAAAIITQNWLHAPQAIQCLNAGKDVYSAVPAGITVAEIQELVSSVERTGLIYMMGETSYYSPYAVYARRRLAEGAFGDIVYCEGEYLHDFDHGLYEVYQSRAGERWLEEAGIPPMYYPTHAIGMVMSITGSYPVSVSCLGWTDRSEDGVFKPDANRYANAFSDETALYRMSDGSIMRHNEFRRIGHVGAERCSIYGTLGCLEVSAKGPVWTSKHEVVDLSDELACAGIPVDPAERDKPNVPSERRYLDTCLAHDVDRLPKEFAGLPNGHGGSHQFLVDDFVKACETRVQPPVNVWQAARYTIPGIIAHESAVKGGVLLGIPDCGNPLKQASASRRRPHA